MKILSTLLSGLALAAALAGACLQARADETIKIGEINSYSGLPSFTEPYRKGWRWRSTRSTPRAESTARKSR